MNYYRSKPYQHFVQNNRAYAREIWHIKGSRRALRKVFDTFTGFRDTEPLNTKPFYNVFVSPKTAVF